MRALGISAISLAMTAAVVSNAYYQKKQFYPSVVYITKSNPCMAVIYLQSLVLVLMLGKLMRKVFLGSLRAAEFEHLMERFWYALTETCLAFTVFRDDFNPKFVALFTVLLFLKSFHWLAEDRVDFMERSPVIGWLFHVRAVALLSCLGLLDYLMIAHAYTSTIDKGPTVQLVFGFEYAILYTMVANITIKYVLHTTELRADTPWENKAVFLLYTELVIGFIRVVLYALFVVIMVRIYTLPLFAFRPMYYTMRNFKKALNDVIMSRRAIRNMNTLYPDATAEELSQSDNICIICREDMVNSSKKLPCGHIFHTSCLRSWFQRQQTCPTCRLNILRTATPTTAAPGGAAAAAAAAAAARGNQEPNNGVADAAVIANNNNIPPQPDANNIFAFANALPNFPQMPNFAQMPNFQFPQFANLQPPINLQPAAAANAAAPNAAAGAAAAAAAVDPNTTAAATTFAIPTTAQMPLPPFVGSPFVGGAAAGFPLLAPYLLPPPPPMPASLQHLSDVELRRLEGTERQHVEERIRLLRNIQLMLDASVALMNQYTAVVAQLPPVPQPAAAAAPAEPAPTQPAAAAGNTAEPSAGPSSSAASVSVVAPTAAAASSSTAASAAVDTAAAAAATAATPVKPIDIVTIEDVGSEEPGDSAQASGGDAAAMELRRRRLEKFMRSEQRGE